MSATPRTEAFLKSHHERWPNWDWDSHGFAYVEWAKKLERENAALLEAVEDLARQHCHTDIALHDYNGQVGGTLVTDSGGLTADSIALRRLADAGRFRIVASHGRMIVGYWPENDPQKKERAAIDAARKEKL